MIVPVCVAAFGSRSTISGWAAISPSPKSSRFAHHRVHRRLDYPASLGLDQQSSDRHDNTQPEGEKDLAADVTLQRMNPSVVDRGVDHPRKTSSLNVSKWQSALILKMLKIHLNEPQESDGSWREKGGPAKPLPARRAIVPIQGQWHPRCEEKQKAI